MLHRLDGAQYGSQVPHGIQAIAMPNVAGGSTVLDDDVAGIVASYQFNENVGLTAVWARPFNDNWDGDSSASNRWTPDATRTTMTMWTCSPSWCP